MLTSRPALLACRARTATLVAVTTGITSLAATATGFARTAGSFIADNFLVGMEVLPSGFVANTPRVITAVSALALTVAGSVTVEAAAGSRSLTVGQPAIRGYPNVPLTTVVGRPYTMESWARGPSNVHTLGPLGEIKAEPTYFLNWYGLAGVGDGAISEPVDALLRLYAPGTAITLPNGDVLEVRGDPAPISSELINPATTPGYALVTVTIPLRVFTPNVL